MNTVVRDNKIRGSWQLAAGGWRVFLYGGFLAAMVVCISILPIRAAGVSVSVSDGSGITDAGSGGQTELTIGWTASGFYTTGTNILIDISPAATSTISNCATASTAFGGSSGSFGSFTTSSAVFTLTDNVATSTAGSLCLSFGLTTSTATNYAISIRTTSSTTGFNTSDSGASLYYVGGGDLVTLTAEVQSSLSFAIRDSADSANTNVCALGTLDPSQVNYCTYRLRIATNAASGFTATIETSGDFTNGSASITPITNDTLFATGTEAYGMAFLTGAISGGRSGVGVYDQPIIEAGSSIDASLTFDTNSTPLDFTSATTILSYTAPFNPAAAPSVTTTSEIVHGAAVSSVTTRGTYTQTITYRVTGSF